MTLERLLTIDDLAARLAVKESWLYQNHRKLGLPAIKLGNQLRFDPVDVEAFLQTVKDIRGMRRISVSGTDSQRKVQQISEVRDVNQR